MIKASVNKITAVTLNLRPVADGVLLASCDARVARDTALRYFIGSC